MYDDPFETMERMYEEMDRLFRRSLFTEGNPLLTHKGEGQLTPWKSIRTPLCHMNETENSVIAAFELPGVQKSDIDLKVDDSSIELKVESTLEKKQKSDDKKSYSYSMESQSFFRRLPLPKEVYADKAVAEYKDGILRVEMPKKLLDEKKSHRLQIK